MKHCLMKIKEESMTSLAMEEVMETLSSSHLISILMTSLKTLIFLAKTPMHRQRNTSEMIFRVLSRHKAGKDVLSRNFPLGVDCLMTCLKTWKKCFPSVDLTAHTGIQCEQETNSMDLVSTAELSPSVAETWLLHIQTVLDNNTSVFFVLCFFFVLC